MTAAALVDVEPTAGAQASAPPARNAQGFTRADRIALLALVLGLVLASVTMAVSIAGTKPGRCPQWTSSSPSAPMGSFCRALPTR